MLTETVEAPRGSEQQFASRNDIVEKFEKLAGHVVPASQVASIRDAVLELEKLPDVTTLTRLLTKN